MMRAIILIVFLTLLDGLCAQNLIPLDLQIADGTQNFAHMQPGDTVYIESGDRSELILRNFSGASGQPIVFIPADKASPVNITTDASYGISIRNCSSIRLAGLQHDRDAFGIRILDLTNESSMGVSISDRSTHIEVDHLEIGRIGFAGIMAKTQPICGDPSTQRGGFVQENTHLHHCWIYDTGGEGLYIGDTNYQGQLLVDCGWVYPPLLAGVEIHDNRLERTGWDGIQVSSAISGCRIYDNYLTECSMGQESSQMAGIIIGGGTLAECFNNYIIDNYGTGIQIFGLGGTRVYNNLIVRPGIAYEPDNPDVRAHGIFILDKSETHKSFYGVFSNTIIQPKSDAIRIGSEQDFEVRVFNNLLVDPGSYAVYEHDNTDRTGKDAFVFLGIQQEYFLLSGNAEIRYLPDARFQHPEADNFRLDVNSPMIDAGRDLQDQPGVNFDMDHKTRPLQNGWDVGAFEYGKASGMAQMPAKKVPAIQVFSSFQDESKAIRVRLEEPIAFSWRIFSATGQLLASGPRMNYAPGNYRLHQLNGVHGFFVVQIIGSDGQFSEKLLVN